MIGYLNYGTGRPQSSSGGAPVLSSRRATARSSSTARPVDEYFASRPRSWWCAPQPAPGADRQRRPRGFDVKVPQPSHGGGESGQAGRVRPRHPRRRLIDYDRDPLQAVAQARRVRDPRCARGRAARRSACPRPRPRRPQASSASDNASRTTTEGRLRGPLLFFFCPSTIAAPRTRGPCRAMRLKLLRRPFCRSAAPAHGSCRSHG